MHTELHSHNGRTRAASIAISTVLLFLMFASAFRHGVLMVSAATAGEHALSASPYAAVGAAADASVSPPTLSAKAAVLMEAETGTVITAVAPDLRLPMASTTKIMTALVALEQVPLDTVVTVSPTAVGIEGSSIYLAEGETLTMEDLLYALLLDSANDAAVAIAVAVAGDVPTFAAMMNERASKLGLSNTHFENPHGLDDPEHYTTARELAIIAKEALQLPAFRQICSTRKHTIPLHNTEGVRLLINHNKLLSAYDGCIGVKTGFTKKTGRCLVSAAERDGLTLIAVTLGAPDDWHDHRALLDLGFSLYERIPLAAPKDYSVPLPLMNGIQDYVIVENEDALTIPLRRDHGEIITVIERRRFDYAPLVGGEMVGRMVFYEQSAHGRRYLGEVPLYTAYTVAAISEDKGFFLRIWSWICDLFD